MRNRADDSLDGAANYLAWLLATVPDAMVRNGAEAVALAERLCQKSNYKIPQLLDTLSAAYAEAGQFDKALDAADQAFKLAHEANDTKLAEQIESHSKLYRLKQPYRDPELKPELKKNKK